MNRPEGGDTFVGVSPEQWEFQWMQSGHGRENLFRSMLRRIVELEETERRYKATQKATADSTNMRNWTPAQWLEWRAQGNRDWPEVCAAMHLVIIGLMAELDAQRVALATPRPLEETR